MIGQHSVLAVITARGGSKGVPRKNIRTLHGKPLLAWTAEAAKRSRYVDRLVLSSEDEEILKVGGNFGCETPFKRPAELALDDTPGIEPVLHAMSQLPRHDWVVLLQPTSPLRTAEDLDACLELCERTGAKSCVSVSESPKSPFWMYRLGDDSRMTPFLEGEFARRQDAPKAYALNGAVYVAQWDWLLDHRKFVDAHTLAHVMPQERSIDIDTELDFTILEAVLKDRK